MKKSKKISSNRAITLMALIITVIVMLVLVAVSVSIIVESDLIGAAEKASDKYKSEQEKEQTLGQITIGNKTYASIGDYINKNPISGGEEPDAGGESALKNLQLQINNLQSQIDEVNGSITADCNCAQLTNSLGDLNARVMALEEKQNNASGGDVLEEVSLQRQINAIKFYAEKLRPCDCSSNDYITKEYADAAYDPIEALALNENDFINLAQQIGNLQSQIDAIRDTTPAGWSCSEFTNDINELSNRISALFGSEINSGGALANQVKELRNYFGTIKSCECENGHYITESDGDCAYENKGTADSMYMVMDSETYRNKGLESLQTWINNLQSQLDTIKATTPGYCAYEELTNTINDLSAKVTLLDCLDIDEYGGNLQKLLASLETYLKAFETCDCSSKDYITKEYADAHYAHKGS